MEPLNRPARFPWLPAKKPLSDRCIRMWVAALLAAWLSAACAIVQTAASRQDDSRRTYRHIKSTLDQCGQTMDYDNLMQIYQTMVQSPHPVAHTDRLLRLLIDKRNDDPRIDQMILIFSARIIGASRHLIPDAQGLFRSILEKDDRINEWVIAFVAEAIGDYIYDLPQGDQLVDFMEIQLDRARSKNRAGEEVFGFHFLPPPKTAFILTYLSGIADQASRQGERTRYYVLIKNNLTEQEIEAALKYLQVHGAPDSGEKCPLLLQCLMHYRNRLPLR